jgi:putative heme-binding domain-containing protein
MIRWFCLPLLMLSSVALAADAENPYFAGDKSNFVLNKGDHIVILGNALAERMTHDGAFEAMLYAAFPEHDLVIRNLGYSGDEIGGYTSKPDPMKRLRSLDFGTADQWLYANAPVPQPDKLKPDAPVRANRFENIGTKPDVIIAMFGYNESFAGEAGLPKFKETLTDFIKHVTSQKYNGKAPPRLILCSPIAHEDLKDPNLPDGKENNARLKLYSAAMKEVADANEINIVDLFGLSNAVYELDSRNSNIPPRKTLDGIHINRAGNILVAVSIAQAFGVTRFTKKHEAKDQIDAFVRDKNLHWFNRYRATDGYSVHGDRAFLKFTDGQSNYEVGQRELEVLDQMVANREAAIHRIARGEKNVKVDDSNLPPFLPVVTNKPGKNADGSHIFNSGEEELKHLTVHKDLQVNLFADEKQFPELINPVQMAFDTKGRLWVAAWPTYPHWKPTTPMNDKLLILEDTDNDGKADVCKTFAGDLHNPTGFEFWGGGVIVAQGPDVLFLKDTDGDDKYDTKERILHGLDTADTHHTANSFSLDPGGALYFQEGTFHHSQIETPWGPPRRVISGAVFRYEPRTKKIDVHVAHNFANPHGHAFDYWGNDIVVDGTGAVPYHGTLFSGHVNFPTKHSTPPSVYKQRTRPCPGLEFVSSTHLPESMRGNLWVPNVIGLQGILQYKVEPKGASLTATEEPLILSSDDANFRPADVEQAPDGSVYFVDWHNPIIGHMQHNLRDPNRNKEKGRVYRITAKDRPLLTPVKIAGEPIPVLLDLIKSHDDRVRYRVRIELSARPTVEVIAATKAWLAKQSNHDKDLPHHLLEALWLHQQHNVVNAELLNFCLTLKQPQTRAAAVKVACTWRDRLPNILSLLLFAAADEAPNVRLEAIRAASFLTVPEAMEIVLVAQEWQLDEYLNYQIKETLKTLDPIVAAAKQENREIAWSTPAGARFRLAKLNDTELLKEKRSRDVCMELLLRSGFPDNIRQEAIRELAVFEKANELTVLMNTITRLDGKPGVESSLIFDLVRLLTSRPKNELTAARKELEKLATTAKQPLFRQIGYVSLMNVDGKIEPALKLAEQESERLLDFVNSVPLVSDAALRAALYKTLDNIIVTSVFPGTATEAPKTRFVRIELPGKGTLTLAEVEVFSYGVNVARKGKANQKNTAYEGDAARAIDGNTKGSYGAGSSTHTEEGTGNPYWEVDLGDKYAVDKIVVYNRTDGAELGARLNNFTVKLLDSNRQTLWEAAKNPAPDVSVAFTPQGKDSAGNLRRAAMLAMANVRGEEAQTFTTLSVLLEKNIDADTAIRGLQRLPVNTWAKARAPALTALLLKQIQETPVADRTSDSSLAKLEFADSLATLLPAEDGKKLRAQLGELGVRVIKLNTVFEKMAYDKEVVVARAGKPVEIVLENSDLMPHNFVVLQPGALEEIGLLSEEQAQDPNFAKAGFVPNSNKVIAKSTLVPPRETTRISVNVPNKPGVYPYVCTYPGHWRRMYGALYVVADLEAYQANPEAYLASSKIEPVDALLKDRRPRTEWKLEDFAEAVAALPKTGGRNWAAGKDAFKIGTCIACHKLDGVGAEYGPDLAKLDPMYKEVDVLRHILNPSEKIVEKYQTYTFEMKSGKTLTGMIVSENSDVIKVIENPLLKAVPLELQVRDLEEKTKLPTSMMPKGLLDKLTRDEVLDLIAYLIARGDQKHPVFSGGGHDHGTHGHKH